jgi:hypothetical protein
MLVQNNNFRTYKSIDSSLKRIRLWRKHNTIFKLSFDETSSSPSGEDRGEGGTFASIPLTLTLSQGRGNIMLDTKEIRS